MVCIKFILLLLLFVKFSMLSCKSNNISSGISNSKADAKMGILCTESVELFFENTPVPVENVLGGVGNGFKVAMAILNNGRYKGVVNSILGLYRIPGYRMIRMFDQAIL